MKHKVTKWLYTYFDGCNGQRVNHLTDEAGAIAILMHHDDLTKKEARDLLRACAKDMQECSCSDGEETLLPVPDEVTAPVFTDEELD